MDQVYKYLKQYIDELVFITLDHHVTQQKKDISFLKGIPLPISVKNITQQISQEEVDNIPFDAFVEGMIYVLGVDYNFKYNEQYKKFLYLANENIEEYILYKGLKFADEEKLYEAAVHFRAVFNMDERNLNAMYNYGKCCRDIFDRSKELEEKKTFKNESINMFESLVGYYPDFNESYYFLGFFYSNQKMFEKARLTWEKFLSLSEDEEKREEVVLKLKEIEDYVVYEKGYSLVLNGNGEKGLKLLLPLEDKYSQWWNLLFFIGLAYRNLNQFNEAIPYFKKVLLNKPSQVDAMNELGLCYMSVEDLDNAEKYYKKALLIKEDHEILCNLGVVYIYKEDYEKALDYLEKSAAICPEDEIVMQWLKKLNEITR